MVELILENEQDKEELTPEIEKAIKDVCVAVMEEEECDFDAEISVTLVDNDTIRSINKEQRDIDRATDVLSFPMLEFDEDGISDDEYDMDGELVMLGDIVISMERAREQANEFGHSFLREVAFLTAHSMLHLLGYDHVHAIRQGLQRQTGFCQLRFRQQPRHQGKVRCASHPCVCRSQRRPTGRHAH